MIHFQDMKITLAGSKWVNQNLQCEFSEKYFIFRTKIVSYIPKRFSVSFNETEMTGGGFIVDFGVGAGRGSRLY